MNVRELIETLRTAQDAPVSVAAEHAVPSRPPQFAAYPDWLLPELRKVFEARGILELYAHQRRAADLLHGGKHVVVATPTASGKSLCYHLPVLDALLRDGSVSARALPVPDQGAVARSDERSSSRSCSATVDREDLCVAVYDGDTPPATRRCVARVGQPGADQPAHAALRHPAEPHQVAGAVHRAALRRDRRGAHAFGGVRLARRQRACGGCSGSARTTAATRCSARRARRSATPASTPSACSSVRSR